MTDGVMYSNKNANTSYLKGKSEDMNPEKEHKMRINRKARLIIRNVSFKATDESLKAHFEPHGEVLEVKLLKKPDGKLVGCAFVHFKNVPMAKKALLNTNMKPFLGRPISVDWAVAKNKYMQHAINQQLEMEEKVKSEESDSDDEESKVPIIDEQLKEEKVKESKSDDDLSSDDEKSSSSSDDRESSLSDDDDEPMNTTEKQRIKLNDAEDGCTVFITNLSFNIDNDQLKEFAEQTGPVKYALVCMDKMTEHSKGSGFVKFLSEDDTNKFLSLPADQLKLDGQVLQVKPALKKENLQRTNKKEPKDNRNLYLVKEGVIVAGTNAAVGVSASDMAKRLALERSKTQMLKNLNRFVSRYRVVVSNLPQQCDDARLRRLCTGAVGQQAVVTEARVMRDLRAPTDALGKHPSKGYGFVMFMRHEDALLCLRKLNNNPDVFDKNNRPIVSFSIEDRTALNARKKRLEKSQKNNPQPQKGVDAKNRKRKHAPDESYLKKRKFEHKTVDKKVNEIGKFVRRPVDDDVISNYTGLTSKEGSQHKMRSNHKLRTQADIHRQNVKLEKKKGKRAFKLKMAARERVKQPKQTVNTTKATTKRRRFKRNKSAF